MQFFELIKSYEDAKSVLFIIIVKKNDDADFINKQYFYGAIYNIDENKSNYIFQLSKTNDLVTLYYAASLARFIYFSICRARHTHKIQTQNRLNFKFKV